MLQFRKEEVLHHHQQLSIRVCANWCDVNNNVYMRGRNAVNDKAVSRNLLVQTAFSIVPSTGHADGAEPRHSLKAWPQSAFGQAATLWPPITSGAISGPSESEHWLTK